MHVFNTVAAGSRLSIPCAVGYTTDPAFFSMRLGRDLFRFLGTSICCPSFLHELPDEIVHVFRLGFNVRVLVDILHHPLALDALEVEPHDAIQKSRVRDAAVLHVALEDRLVDMVVVKCILVRDDHFPYPRVALSFDARVDLVVSANTHINTRI